MAPKQNICSQWQPSVPKHASTLSTHLKCEIPGPFLTESQMVMCPAPLDGSHGVPPISPWPSSFTNPKTKPGVRSAR